MRVLCVLAALSFSIAAGCGEQATPDEEGFRHQGDAAAIEEGCTLYSQNCAGCHGDQGHGDGLHAMHLMPGATSLVAPESIDKSVEHRFERIMNGGAVPPYNSGMPAYQGVLSEDDVWKILALIHSMAHGGGQVCALEGGAGGAGGTGGAGVGGAGGTGGAGGVPPHCTQWCSCLTTHCSTFSGYPFASVEDCHATCMQTEESLIACWQDFCDDVPNNPGLAEHQCEHAWGALGNFECE
ncbi:MAG: c-type cytochrome [Polyangiaceae bacterium]